MWAASYIVRVSRSSQQRLSGGRVRARCTGKHLRGKVGEREC